ncbi:MAG: Asp-tRNA(Asn)/Glu-tRNA(Gln) amidotransferase subunit GatA [Bacteroidia bacterium]|nr:Asp-tRNA(Asn)/Glu-tRNA(Gln) amidotransferase subunit GatA [Bacteroidia bacterium]MDW8302626.1 Asp-tRNA(Asn)/Glu-tRNA(Gln) amidotransferase subunit GatA [Bacteroidia bacterium]
MNYISFAHLQEDLKTQKITCQQILTYYLNRIEQNKHLNAFLEVFTESATQTAIKIDEKIKQGKAIGKLAGMVIGIKDVFAYKGHNLNAASKILQNFKSIYTATCVQRLIDEDAIIIGRLNCDEFAMGSSNENSAFGNVLNYLNTDYVPGGSSGGSAVAVSADLCWASLGTDTGGSIRQPASFCGVIGLKPSYGRISRYGIVAYASSFDQAGTFTKNIEDAALLLSVMAGKDDYDATCSEKPVPNYLDAIQLEPQKLKFAVLKSVLESEGLADYIRVAFENKVKAIESQGHTVTYIDFPYLDYLIPTYYVLTTAEASSNLARYDGIRYGYRSQNVSEGEMGLEQTYTKSRTEGFGKEVKRRIMLGTFVLSAGYYDAYYTKAQKVRRILYNFLKNTFTTFDAILLPATPTSAFKFGEKTKDPVSMYLSDIYTVLANLGGNPAISIPLGKNPANNLPFGLQIITDTFEEGKLLQIAKHLQNMEN